jgi:hypothetical protein
MGPKPNLKFISQASEMIVTTEKKFGHLYQTISETD